MSKPKEPNFETALKQLEEIVQLLEKGDLPLEDSLRCSTRKGSSSRGSAATQARGGGGPDRGR